MEVLRSSLRLQPKDWSSTMSIQLSRNSSSKRSTKRRHERHDSEHTQSAPVSTQRFHVATTHQNTLDGEDNIERMSVGGRSTISATSNNNQIGLVTVKIGSVQPQKLGTFLPPIQQKAPSIYPMQSPSQNERDDDLDILEIIDEEMGVNQRSLEKIQS